MPRVGFGIWRREEQAPCLRETACWPPISLRTWQRLLGEGRFCMQVLPCRSIGERRAHAHARRELAEGGFRSLAVLDSAGIAVVVVAAASRDALSGNEGGSDPLPDIPRHVVDSEGAPRSGVQAD